MAFLFPGQFLARVEVIRKRAPLHTTCPLPFSLENAFTVRCPPGKLLLQGALGALGTTPTCPALPQPGIRHCKKRRGTKHIQTLSHSLCWSCASVLAADNTRFVFSQLNCSPNPIKMRSICLDRRMCHLRYQGQSRALSLGRAPLGWHGARRGGDVASGSNPRRLP